MGSQYRHRRTSDPTNAFPQLEPGEISVNTANRQLAVGDANGATIGAPIALISVRFFDTRAQYATGDLMVRAGVIYRALVNVPPGNFNGAQWEAISGALNPAYVQKAGDTMTGALTLAGDPANPLEAVTKQYSDSKLAKAGGTMTGDLTLAGNPTTPAMAATKSYVDAQVAAKAAVFISDTPPVGVPDNSLWWESDTGLMFVRYNDGDSTQWVLAMPVTDTASFVQKTGDTMSGDLTISALVSQLILNKQAGGSSRIFGKNNDVLRWALQLGDGGAESGSDAGSNFGLIRYNDAGGLLGTVLSINRASGLATVFADPTAALGIATKQYVDTRVRTDAAQGLNTAQQAQGRSNIAAQASLAPFTVVLGANINLPSNVWTDVLSINVGAGSTSLVIATVSLKDNAGMAPLSVRLFDGATQFASSGVIYNAAGAGYRCQGIVAAIVTNPAGGVIKVQAISMSGSTAGVVVANDSGSGKDTQMSALKIA
ncbi:hypothetical protein ABH975_003459 [Bradyrhizobium ottawaense]|uniref:hypothetical protein n=1 Tax=Bradyrhizobium ottawaense TaxID=931866 RepID=UPI003511B96A